MFGTDLHSILIFYVISSLYTILGIFIASKLLNKAYDKGYGVAKVLGLVLFSYITWFVSSAFKVKIEPLYLWVALGFLCFLVIGILRERFLNYFSSSWKIIVFEELLYILFFAFMIAYRAAVPRIEGIEKFMDFALINGIVKGKTLPPQDVWYAGSTVNYYYFGHFCLALITLLTNISSVVLYNIFVAYIFALSALGAFSIGLNLSKSKICGIITAFLVVFAGNLDYMFKAFTGKGANYFYADARSLIEYTINEFPSYSFIISDLHAHILDVPFVLLFLYLIYYFYENYAHISKKLFLLLLSLSLGVLGVTNSWDLLIYFPVFVLVLFISKIYDLVEKKLKVISKQAFIECLKYLAVVLTVGAGSVIYFGFYYISTRPNVAGFGVTHDHLPLLALSKMFGFFIVNIIIFDLFITSAKKLEKRNVLITVLSIYGLLLILFTNFFFLKDIYFQVNPPYYRANTIFKFWYQVWIIYSIISAYVIYKLFYFFIYNKRYLLIFPILINLFLVFYIFKYPIISYRYTVGPKYVYYGLDGSAYLLAISPGDKDIIDWLNKNEKKQVVILEAPGKSYSMDSVVASYTGLPTVLGWYEHELGWRGNWPLIADKMGEVEKMYTSADAKTVFDLLKKYQVKYVVISKAEIANYHGEAGNLIKDFSRVVVNSNDSLLLKIY
jgi:uncharacterized membrane protein